MGVAEFGRSTVQTDEGSHRARLNVLDSTIETLEPSELGSRSCEGADEA